MPMPDADLISEIKLEGKAEYDKQVDDSAKKTEQANEQMRRSSKKASDQINQQRKETSRATDATTNFGRILSDLPFGMVAVSNNIVPMVESFQRLKAEVGSTGSAMSAMMAFMKGPGGLIIGASLLSGAMAAIPMIMRALGTETKKAKEELESLEQVLKRLLSEVVSVESNVDRKVLSPKDLQSVVTGLESYLAGLRFSRILTIDPIIASTIISEFKKQLEEEAKKQKISDAITSGLKGTAITIPEITQIAEEKYGKKTYTQVLNEIDDAEKALANATIDRNETEVKANEKTLKSLYKIRDAYELLGATELNILKTNPHEEYSKAWYRVGQQIKDADSALDAYLKREEKLAIQRLKFQQQQSQTGMFDSYMRDVVPDRVEEVKVELTGGEEFALMWQEATQDGMTTIKSFSRDAASTIVDAMYGAKVQLKDIFDAMAKDFLRAFIQMGILKLLDLIFKIGGSPVGPSNFIPSGPLLDAPGVPDAGSIIPTTGFAKLDSSAMTIVVETPSPEATRAYHRELNRKILIPDTAEYALTNTGGRNPFKT